MTSSHQGIFRRSRVACAGFAAAGLLALSGTTGAVFPVVPVANAHDSVVGGSIQNGDVLDEFPREITLEFSAIPKEGFNTFAVTNTETDEVLFSGEPSLDGRNLTLSVPADVNPGPGEYQVGFQITSSDGHATRGSVPFTVAGEAAPGEAAQGDGEATSTGEDNTGGLEGPMKWIAAAGGLLAFVAVVAVMIAKRRTLGEGK